MKRKLTELSALYENAIARADEAWEVAQPEVRGRPGRGLRKYVLCVRRCAILKEMIKDSVEATKEDDFNEPLPVRACNLDDESCESCS